MSQDRILHIMELAQAKKLPGETSIDHIGGVTLDDVQRWVFRARRYREFVVELAAVSKETSEIEHDASQAVTALVEEEDLDGLSLGDLSILLDVSGISDVVRTRLLGAYEDRLMKDQVLAFSGRLGGGIGCHYGERRESDVSDVGHTDGA